MPELKWIKSSYSEASGNNCVEVAVSGEDIAVRDSKAPSPILTFSPEAFTALVRGVTKDPLD